MFNIGGFLLRMASRVPFLFIAGHLYGTSRYGVYVLATAIIESAAVIGTFGFKLTLFRFLHDAEGRPAEYVVRHVVALTIGIAITLATLLWLSSGLLAELFNMPAAGPIVAFLAWFIPAIVLADILLAATWAKRVVHFDVVARSIVEPMTTTLMAYVLFRFGAPEMGLPIAYAVGFSCSAIASMISFGRLYSWGAFLQADFSLPYLRNLARQSASTSVHDVIGLLFGKMDILAVGYFFDTQAVGLYGMAQQFLTVMEKVTLSFVPVLLPVLTEALRSRDIQRARGQLFAVGRRVVLMQAPIVLLFVAAGPFLLRLIGPGFPQAWGILLVLTFGVWINGTLGLSELALLSIRPHANPQASIMRLLLYAAALVPLQALCGVRGVALANVLATLTANLTRVALCWPGLRQPRNA
jgi:O-antigen/teichoic acid export membrane protein